MYNFFFKQKIPYFVVCDDRWTVPGYDLTSPYILVLPQELTGAVTGFQARGARILGTTNSGNRNKKNQEI